MKERKLLVTLQGTTVGITETTYNDGKFTATTSTGEVWPMVELRPMNWKRGKMHIKDLEKCEIEKRKQ